MFKHHSSYIYRHNFESMSVPGTVDEQLAAQLAGMNTHGAHDGQDASMYYIVLVYCIYYIYTIIYCLSAVTITVQLLYC